MKTQPILGTDLPNTHVLVEINSGNRIHIAAKIEDRTLCGRKVYAVLGSATSWNAECPTCIRRLTTS